MARPDFSSLRDELIATGMAPGRVRRTITELGEHFDDIVDDAVLDGIDRQSAEAMAIEQLGPLQNVAREVMCRPELRGWAYRFPRLALVIYPITCLALLPAVPVFAGVANAPQLARWTACIIASGFVTAAIMLVLHFTIFLS